MTLREALTRAVAQLDRNPDLRADAMRDAVLLAMHVLGMSRAAMVAHPERTVTLEEQAAYQAAIYRRLTCEPVQYITGEQEFYGLALRVTRDVLIPRPETEGLVEAVLEELAGAAGPVRIVDVGTGSGAIALALATKMAGAEVWAVDCSVRALEVARENAARLGLAIRTGLEARLGLKVRFVEGDLLTGLAAGEFDAVVSNPPYVPEGDRAGMHPQVRDWEPAGALFAGVDGLEVYRRLVPQAWAALRPGGLLAMEIGAGQREAVQRLLGGWSEVRCVDDLQGIPRVMLGQRPSA